jgi:DNA polymerase elongation subunit (family B)
MKPKLLLFDIETTPIKAYVWTMWEANVIKILEDWYMLSFAYKWYGEKKVHVWALPDFKLYHRLPHNDKELIEKLWGLFNEADIIIGHNANSFDIKKTNTRFLIHNLPPPSTYKTVDTLKEFRKHMGFSSNKLNDLSIQLDGDKKERVDKEVWFGCINGDMKEWSKMKKYNKKDVVLLENRYKDILPFITTHPNLNLLNETFDKCPNCSGRTVKAGYNISRVAKYHRLHCMNCGAWSQKPINKVAR